MRSFAVRSAFHNVPPGIYTVRIQLLDASGNELIAAVSEQPLEVLDAGPEPLDVDPPEIRPLREKPGHQPGQRPPKPPKPV